MEVRDELAGCVTGREVSASASKRTSRWTSRRTSRWTSRRRESC